MHQNSTSYTTSYVQSLKNIVNGQMGFICITNDNSGNRLHWNNNWLTRGCNLSPSLVNSAFPRPALAIPFTRLVEAPCPIPNENNLKNKMCTIPFIEDQVKQKTLINRNI